VFLVVLRLLGGQWGHGMKGEEPTMNLAGGLEGELPAGEGKPGLRVGQR
jgi:hypothetical protein